MRNFCYQYNIFKRRCPILFQISLTAITTKKKWSDAGQNAPKKNLLFYKEQHINLYKLAVLFCVFRIIVNKL